MATRQETMRVGKGVAVLLALGLALAGCREAPDGGDSMAAAAPESEMDRIEVTGSRLKASDGDSGLVGQQNDEGAFLAYSHEATVRIGAGEIAGRVDAVRTACMERRFGQCTVAQPIVGMTRPRRTLQKRSTSGCFPT